MTRNRLLCTDRPLRRLSRFLIGLQIRVHVPNATVGRNFLLHNERHQVSAWIGRRLQRRRSGSVPVVVPEVSVGAVKKRRKQGSKKPGSKKPGSRKPVFGETYDDLDAILNGAGDAAPIAARPQRIEPVSSSRVTESERADQEYEAPQSRMSSVGLIAAIISSTLAFWFGVVCVVARFGAVDQPIVRGFTTTLYSIYACRFGDYEISSGLQTIIVALGWAFWLAAIVLMLLGAGQFCNAIYRLITGDQFFSWSDGLTGTLGVVTLFLVVGLLFAQTSLHREQQKFLSDYEAPVVAEGGHLEIVDALRAELRTEQSRSRNWLILGAVVPMSVFIFSTIPLFTKR